MIIQAMPYPVGGGGTAEDVLVYLTSASTDATVPFDTEAYDASGWHDPVTNNDQLVAPSDALIRFLVCIEDSDDQVGASTLKGGSSFFGHSRRMSQSFASSVASATSAIVSAAEGDVFTVGRGTLESQAGSWAAIEIVPSATKRALVKKTGNQSLSAATATILTWDAEDTDTDGFHDNSTNNSRLTVPSGVSLVRVTASYTPSPPGNQLQLDILKNGAHFPGSVLIDQHFFSGTAALNGASAIIAVSSGDYFEARAVTINASTIGANDSTWFQIEEIGSATPYALVYKNATQSVTSGSATAVAFGAEAADTGNFHDNSTNNSRLTIPAGQGITQARLSFALRSANAAGKFEAHVRKNGASTTDVPGLPGHYCDSDGSDNISGMGAWIDVEEGDYFELFVTTGANQTLPAVEQSWLCIECR